MKKLKQKLKYFLSVQIAIFMSLQWVHAQADQAGHGGDTEISTIDQVKLQINYAAKNFVRMLNKIALDERIKFKQTKPNGEGQFEHLSIIVDPQSNAIFQTILKLGEPTWENLPLSFQLKESGPCISEEGTDHTGSAKIGDLLTPYCLSISELRHIPPSELLDQLLPLIGHEIAHKVGYDENSAKHFQSYLLTVWKDRVVQKTLEYISNETLSVLSRFWYLDHSNMTDAQLCANLGIVSGLLYSLESLGLNLEYRATWSPNQTDDSRHDEYALLSRFAPVSFLGFCGVESRDDPQWMKKATLSKGDRAELQKVMKYYDDKIIQFKDAHPYFW